MRSTYLHEDLSRQSAEEKSSERELGVTFAAILSVIGFVRLYQGHDWWATCLFAAAIFLFLAFFWVAPLRPINRLWYRLGLFLFHMVNPVIMGVVFFVTIFPIGLLMRILGKDQLKLKFDHETETYWEKKEFSTAASQGMKNQF